MIYTSDSLIAAIKRNAQFPSSQRRFEDDDFLAFLNEELQLTIVDELTTLQASMFIERETRALVASQSEYEFPNRAIGWKVASVGHLSASNVYTRLPQIARSNRGRYQNIQENATPAGFYVEGTKIHFVPNVSASPAGSVQFDFIRIQNELVKESVCGEASLVATVGVNYDITVNSVPVYSGGVDVISGTNPFNVIARNSTPVVLGLIMTIPIVDFDRAPVIGDWISVTGKTPIPNIPEDFHPVLAQAATIRCLISNNDEKGLTTAMVAYTNMIKRMTNRAKDRVDSSPVKIVPQSRVLGMMR
jgi:hypothetical protein